MAKAKKPKAVLVWGVCDEEGIYRAYIHKDEAADEAAWDYTCKAEVVRVRIVPVPVAKKRKAKKVKP